MNQLAQDLRAAKALIDTPQKWTQRAFAKTADGALTTYTAEDAACFCSAGAIFRVVGDAEPRERACLDALGATMGTHRLDIPKFNDTRTHAEVMAAWDAAIAAAEAQS